MSETILKKFIFTLNIFIWVLYTSIILSLIAFFIGITIVKRDKYLEDFEKVNSRVTNANCYPNDCFADLIFEYLNNSYNVSNKFDFPIKINDTIRIEININTKQIENSTDCDKFCYYAIYGCSLTLLLVAPSLLQINLYILSKIKKNLSI